MSRPYRPHMTTSVMRGLMTMRQRLDEKTGNVSDDELAAIRFIDKLRVWKWKAWEKYDRQQRRASL